MHEGDRLSRAAAATDLLRPAAERRVGITINAKGLHLFPARADIDNASGGDLESAVPAAQPETIFSTPEK